MSYPLVWLLLFSVVGVVEAAALIDRRDGDTLSEQVWRLLAIRWLRPFLWVAWAILTVHFFLRDA